MGESMSRYSIVERLTDKKMTLIDERDNLEVEAKKAEQEVAFRKKNLEKDKKAILDNSKLDKARMLKNAEREHKLALEMAERKQVEATRVAESMLEDSQRQVERVERELAAFEMRAKNLQDNLKVKKDSINTKIVAIEKALERLEEISKTAPQN
jgi:fibronectin type 3 domain-containing protein